MGIGRRGLLGGVGFGGQGGVGVGVGLGWGGMGVGIGKLRGRGVGRLWWIGCAGLVWRCFVCCILFMGAIIVTLP